MCWGRGTVGNKSRGKIQRASTGFGRGQKIGTSGVLNKEEVLELPVLGRALKEKVSLMKGSKIPRHACTDTPAAGPWGLWAPMGTSWRLRWSQNTKVVLITEWDSRWRKGGAGSKKKCKSPGQETLPCHP